MTAKEQAERIVMDYMKKLGSSGSFVVKLGSMSVAKQLTHYTVDKIIEELRLHIADCYNGLERKEFWKEVKRNIDDAYKD